MHPSPAKQADGPGYGVGLTGATASTVAKTSGRKEFGRMVEFLRSHPDCRILLVEKTDRQYRNLRDWVTMDELQLEIHFVKEGIVLSRDSKSAEMFIHGIKMALLRDGLKDSHEDQKRFHKEAVTRLQAERSRLQQRLDAIYVNKLDGRIDQGFYDAKAEEWWGEQDRILDDIRKRLAANRSYTDEGIRLLELARTAQQLFRKQPAREKSRLLDFVLSNCTWKNGEITPTWRKPFDLLVSAT